MVPGMRRVQRVHSQVDHVPLTLVLTQLDGYLHNETGRPPTYVKHCPQPCGWFIVAKMCLPLTYQLDFEVFDDCGHQVVALDPVQDFFQRLE